VKLLAIRLSWPDTPAKSLVVWPTGFFRLNKGQLSNDIKLPLHELRQRSAGEHSPY